MTSRFKEMLKLLSIPLTLLIVYMSLFVLWKVFGLPSNEELLVLVKDWFAQYGLWIVFISAIIEGFLLIGQYFPGSFIIFLGVISAGKDVGKVIEVVGVISIAFIIAYALNYIVGKFGWYKLLARFGLGKQIENSKEKLTKHGLNTIFLSYWEPNLASLTATAAGVLHVPFKKFLAYSVFAVIIWNIFWGVLVYYLGESALKIAGLKWVLIIFAVWVSAIVLKKYLDNRKAKSGI